MKEQTKHQDSTYKFEKEKFLEEKKKLKLENLNLKQSLQKAQRDLKDELKQEKLAETRKLVMT